MSRKIRERRERLYTKCQGRCYWCGIQTVMPRRGIHNQQPQDDWATLDHLRTRLEGGYDEYGLPLPGSRYEPNVTNEERTVLCCWKCNNIRGILLQLTSEVITLVLDEHSPYPVLETRRFPISDAGSHPES